MFDMVTGKNTALRISTTIVLIIRRVCSYAARYLCCICLEPVPKSRYYLKAPLVSFRPVRPGCLRDCGNDSLKARPCFGTGFSQNVDIRPGVFIGTGLKVSRLLLLGDEKWI